ncbi:MAG TPA: cohesin domain-containing protein, partial [Anaerolineaceae bacterium]|nr:cohesin domain-containing protein [Anaerolineaceae bacterium]
MKMVFQRVLSMLAVIILLAVSVGISPVTALPPVGTQAGLMAMPGPIHQFEGLSRALVGVTTDNVAPDVSGAPGRFWYLQAVNTSLALYTKTSTGVPFLQSTFDTLWTGAGTGTICDGGGASHHGQVGVLYDTMAQRWVVMDTAYTDIDNGPYFICVAVSITDPSSSTINPATFFTNANWYYYTIQVKGSETGPSLYPDLPRISLWPDGYYLTADLYDLYNSGLNRTPSGAKVWALNREDLVNGDTVTFRSHSVFLTESQNKHGLQPSNVLGTPPPTGTPNFVATIAPPNNFYLWKYSVNWIDPDSSTFTLTTIPMSENFSWAVGYQVMQPGTNERLQIHGNRLTAPLQYREVNGTPTLWATHTILDDDGGSVLRWYELRNMTSTPYFYQQGTYNPDDNAYRWLGSLAVDVQGNMALGFSTSYVDTNNAAYNIFPSIKYAGRLSSDSLNSLGQGEALLYSGTSYQDNVNGSVDGEWGRNSSMMTDPVDECVFWYTNEYYSSVDFPFPPLPTDVHNLWRTRIGWFRFNNCGAGQMHRVSLHTNDTQSSGHSGDQLEGYNVAISGDGRYVAFSSEGINLVDGDTNGKRDIFLRDRDFDQDGIFDEPGSVKTMRLSTNPSNGLQGNGDSWEVAISSDGRFVAFSSYASNLVTGDSNGFQDVFLYDRDTDLDGIFDEAGAVNLVRASVSTSGAQGNSASDQPAIAVDYNAYNDPTDDVVLVTFRSYGNNLVIGDSNTRSDIFYRNIFAGQTFRASVGPGGVQSNANSFSPAISADGRYIVFVSEDTAWGLGDAAYDDIFRYDTTGINPTQIISLGTAGNANGDSYHPAVAADGDMIVFASRATNLIAVDPNGFADIFMWNPTIPTPNFIMLLSIGFDPSIAANGDSFNPSISADGHYIAYASDASNLDLTPDINAMRDIFFHDADTGMTRRITQGYNGSEANNRSVVPVISAVDGRHIAFSSSADNLVVSDTNTKWDVFVYDRDGVIPTFLTIPANIPGYPGQLVSIPVNFTGYGQNISTTAFSVDYDEQCLQFDPGVSNVVTWGLPSGYTGNYTFNSGDIDGELDFSIYTLSNPPSNYLQDGTLATIRLRVKANCQATPGTTRAARVGFSKDPRASFGNSGQ